LLGAAIGEVLAQQAPPAPTADYSGLKASITAVEKGANLSEVLTLLVSEANKHVERAAMFIVKNNAAVGWYARGFTHNDAVKSLTVPLAADTVFRLVHTSRHAMRGHVSHSPATAQALSRLGGDPQGILAVPLILRDKVAAVLYCDTSHDEMPAASADLLEILVAFAGKVVDVLSAAPRPAAPGPAVGGTSPALRPPGPVAAPDGTGPGISLGTGTMRPPAAPSTMLRPPTTPPVRMPAPPTPPPAPPPPPGAPPARAIPPEDQKAHDDAKRFARLVVSEIKLYNEAKVTEGRKTRDIYERLKEDIERGRQMYHDRVSAPVRDSSDYFHDELVRILAGGDPTALGST